MQVMLQCPHLLQAVKYQIDENVHTVNLEGSRDRVGAKLLLEKLAEELGIELNLPWNFVPESISIVGKK